MITKLSDGFSASCDVCRRDFKPGYPIKKEEDLHNDMHYANWAVVWTKGAKRVYCPYCLGLRKPPARRKKE